MKKVPLMFVLFIILLAGITSCTVGPVVQVKTPAQDKNIPSPASTGQVNLPAVSIQLNPPGPNPQFNTAAAHGGVAGILMGVWHGFISPVTLVLSFLNKDSQIQMYEVHNDGSQYNLGFFLGIALLFVILGGIVGFGR
jgi:hypothetical protein